MICELHNAKIGDCQTSEMLHNKSNFDIDFKNFVAYVMIQYFVYLKDDNTTKLWSMLYEYSD